MCIWSERLLVVQTIAPQGCRPRLTDGGGLWRVQALDENDSGGLDYSEFSDGLSRLQVTPRIYCTEEDWDILTENKRLCNAHGESLLAIVSL